MATSASIWHSARTSPSCLASGSDSGDSVATVRSLKRETQKQGGELLDQFQKLKAKTMFQMVEDVQLGHGQQRLPAGVPPWGATGSGDDDGLRGDALLDLYESVQGAPAAPSDAGPSVVGGY